MEQRKDFNESNKLLHKKLHNFLIKQILILI